MKAALQHTAAVIQGMRNAYSNGENATEWYREYIRTKSNVTGENHLFSTLVAYDLQAGSYAAAARSNRGNNNRWCRQIADLLMSVTSKGDSIMEVGVGEATTLSGVLSETDIDADLAFGFDVSWSRISEGKKWLLENGRTANLFVADLLNMPLLDNAVDVVYSSHSLEPNRGKEIEALSECLRVARKAVLLVEPIYELASPAAQARMRHHGYVEGLRNAAEALGAEVIDYRLLDYSSNPLNPSGVLCIRKALSRSQCESLAATADRWRCPVTSKVLRDESDLFYAPEAGLAYPVLRGIPMLRAEHAIVASKLSGLPEKS